MFIICVIIKLIIKIRYYMSCVFLAICKEYYLYIKKKIEPYVSMYHSGEHKMNII